MYFFDVAVDELYEVDVEVIFQKNKVKSGESSAQSGDVAGSPDESAESGKDRDNWRQTASGNGAGAENQNSEANRTIDDGITEF